MPDFILESALGGRVAGLDEVGRGPLAGPVLAAAVVLTPEAAVALAPLLDDSKKLSASRRERALAALRVTPGVEIGLGAASVAEIARLNILQAALLAMRRAVAHLPLPPDAALVDGTIPPGLACPTRCVVGGDGRCLSIAAASIAAKVVRDRAMARLSLRYPAYQWARNAGYGTAVHRAALEAQGISPHHRQGFGLVRKLVEKCAITISSD